LIAQGHTVRPAVPVRSISSACHARFIDTFGILRHGRGMGWDRVRKGKR